MAVISFVGCSVPVEEFDEFLNRSDGNRVNESDGFLEVASLNSAVMDFDFISEDSEVDADMIEVFSDSREAIGAFFDDPLATCCTCTTVVAVEVTGNVVQDFGLLGDVVVDVDSLVNSREVVRFCVGLLVILDGDVSEVLMDICGEVVYSCALLSDAFELLEDSVDIMSGGLGVLEALAGTFDDIVKAIKDFESVPYDASGIVKEEVDFVCVPIDTVEVGFNVTCVVVDVVDTVSLDWVATIKYVSLMKLDRYLIFK